MSGPPYPHPNPIPGSNAIGSFEIGVSPIGTISAFDIWRTVINQYANSPIISRLCTNMGQYLDLTADFDNFFDTVWNVDTAIGYGLDIWGRIVGVNRVLQIPVGGRYLGFEEAGGATVDPFNQSPFFSGQPITSNFALSDDAFRVLIFAKALANISDGSIKAINQLLRNLFAGRGNCYVVDNLDMTMTYMFKFILTPVEAAIVEQTGVLPKPVGVLSNVVQDY
jgi:hypothetical protein